MDDAFERAYVGRMARRLLSTSGNEYLACQAVLLALNKHSGWLGLDLPGPVAEVLDHDNKKAAEARPVVLAHLDEILELLRPVAASAEPADDALVRHLAWLAEIVGLDPFEQEILELGLRYAHEDCVEDMVDNMRRRLGMPRSLALLLGQPRAEMQRRLMPDRRLVDSGMVRVNPERSNLASDDPDEYDYLEIAPTVRTALLQPAADRAALRDGIFGPGLAAALLWDDFGHMGADRELIRKVMQGAVRRREKGVNILLHGPPGCGKTEFCKTLAARLDLTLVAVAEIDRYGRELRRDQRLGSLRFLQQMAAGQPGTVLVFDEMEDAILGSYRDRERSNGRTGSKAFFNRLLESNPVPVLWTSNDIWHMDPAFLRRMTVIHEMRSPGQSDRERLWRRVVGDSRLDCADDEIRRLAEELEVAPAIVANAVRAAELAGGGAAEMRRTAHGLVKAIEGRRPPPGRDEAAFDTRLANADLDLTDFKTRVETIGVRPFSLCLYGPPGTGKTAFAYELAETLDLKPLKKRMSDLLSKWVGATEQKIAGAFEEAAAGRALLIFDEADALLGDRSGAVRSWEISQVAEMLTWMEAHPLPFVCTTNLMDRLDAASLRRFTFKVKFDYLTAEQVALAFESFFGRPVPAAARALANLTPGDFATVKKKAAVLGQENDPTALAAMLAAESAAKPDQPKPLGFLRQVEPAQR